MADGDNSGPSVVTIVLFGLVALFLLWLFTGGPERTENKYNPFLRQPAPIEDFSVYGAGGTVQTEVENLLTEGEYSGWSVALRPDFSFLTPPGWQASVTGNFEDTEFGEITDGDITLQYQYGPEANELLFEDNLSYEVVYGQVNGRQAKFVRPIVETGETTGAFIKRNRRKRITIFTNEELTPEQEQRVFEIINTIRI
jgi:hypothetical protein